MQQKGDYSFTSEHIAAVHYYNLGTAGRIPVWWNRISWPGRILSWRIDFFYLNNMFPPSRKRAADARLGRYVAV